MDRALEFALVPANSLLIPVAEGGRHPAFTGIFCSLSSRSLGPCPYHRRIHKSAVTKPRNTMAITPFMVKNAAFRRRRSRGETMECS